MEEAIAANSGARRSVDAGRGIAWWQQAWVLFMKNPVMWVVFGLIFFVGSAVLSMVPVLGGIVLALLTQVIVGGWMLSARKLEAGGVLAVPDLFSGFKDKLNPLLVLGAVALVATLVMGAMFAMVGVGAFFGMAGGGERSGLMVGAGMMIVGIVVGLALIFVLAMAFWFAPALVVFGNAAPVDALKQSWAASLANIVPFAVYSVLWLVAAVVASIPLGLGWIVLGPLMFLGMYCSWQDIFGPAPAP